MDVVVFVVNGAEEVLVSAARVTKTHEQEQDQGQRLEQEPDPDVMAVDISEGCPSFRAARRLEARLPCFLPRIYVGMCTKSPIGVDYLSCLYSFFVAPSCNCIPLIQFLRLFYLFPCRTRNSQEAW